MPRKGQAKAVGQFYVWLPLSDAYVILCNGQLQVEVIPYLSVSSAAKNNPCQSVVSVAISLDFQVPTLETLRCHNAVLSEPLRLARNATLSKFTIVNFAFKMTIVGKKFGRFNNYI